MGLQTVIPTALLFSTIGYPFILPDMIGGNVYYDEDLPSEELFIRWMQLNAFMPSMQFSISPWQYDDSRVIEISKKYMDIYENFVSPIVQKLAVESTVKGSDPIIRALHYVAPTDEKTFA